MTNIYLDEHQYEMLIKFRNCFVVKPLTPISTKLKTNMEVFVTYPNTCRIGVRAIIGPICTIQSLDQLSTALSGCIYPYQYSLAQKELFYSDKYSITYGGPPSGWVFLHLVYQP